MSLLSLGNRFVFQISATLMVVGLVYFANKKPNYSVELPESLASVKCPPGFNSEENDALVPFADRKVYSLCVGDGMLKHKHLLACDLSFEPPDCGKHARMVMSFSRLKKNGEIYSQTYPESYRKSRVTTAAPANSKTIKKFTSERSSVLYIHFEKAGEASAKSQKDKRKAVKNLVIPSQFKVLDKFSCETQASLLNRAYCYGMVKSGEVYISLTLDVPQQAGKKMSFKTYQTEINAWLGFVDQLIIPKD